MYRRLVMIVAVILATTAIIGCKGNGQEVRKMPPPLATVAQVESGEVYIMNHFIGKIEAANKASISARVNGFLEKRHVEEGDFVKKGDLLMTIEESQYIAAVKQAEATLAQANANANNARLQKDRGAQLLKSAGISQARYDELHALDQVGQANIMAARATLDNAKLSLSYTKVVAPLDGKVGLINFNEGETVGPSSGPLVTVIEQGKSYVLFSITDRELQDLRRIYGTTRAEQLANSTDLFITLSDGTEYDKVGTINFTDNYVNHTTGSIILRGEFENPDGVLVHGQTISLVMRSKERATSVIIPASAILDDVGGKYVFIVDEEGVARRRQLELGVTMSNNRQVILNGLSNGETIVVAGVQRVNGGHPITAVTAKEYEDMVKEAAGGGK